MARRFGRNQKRKLRSDAANAKIAMDAALDRSRQYAQEADRDRLALWDVVRRLELLLGSQSSVLPPKNAPMPDDFYGEAARVLMFRPPGISPFPGRGVPMREVEMLMMRLDTQLRVDPDPMLRAQQCLSARIQLGRLEFGAKKILDYWITADGLRVMEIETFIQHVSQSFAWELANNFVVRNGRLCEKEQKT